MDAVAEIFSQRPSLSMYCTERSSATTGRVWDGVKDGRRKGEDTRHAAPPTHILHVVLDLLAGIDQLLACAPNDLVRVSLKKKWWNGVPFSLVFKAETFKQLLAALTREQRFLDEAMRAVEAGGREEEYP